MHDKRDPALAPAATPTSIAAQHGLRRIEDQPDWRRAVEERRAHTQHARRVERRKRRLRLALRAGSIAARTQRTHRRASQ